MEPRHSYLGIASAMIAFLTVCFCFIVVIISAVAGAVDPALTNSTSPLMVFLGILLLMAMFVNLIGFGLGFADFFYPDRKRLFPIFGIILTTITFVVFVVFMIIGSLTAPPDGPVPQAVEPPLNDQYR